MSRQIPRWMWHMLDPGEQVLIRPVTDEAKPERPRPFDFVGMVAEMMDRIEADQVIDGESLRTIAQRWGVTRMAAGMMVGAMMLRIEEDQAIHRDSMIAAAQTWGL